MHNRHLCFDHVHGELNMVEKMESRGRGGLLRGLVEAAGVFGAAIRVSNAVRNHSRPAASDLTLLGIDASQFRRINRF
jgi:hypothetical protein